MAEGKSNKMIAECLFISPATVKTHILHIFDNLQVKSHVEVSRYFKN